MLNSLSQLGFSRLFTRNFILGILLLYSVCIGYLYMEVQKLHVEHRQTEKFWINQLIQCDSLRVSDYIQLRQEAKDERDKLITELAKPRKK